MLKASVPTFRETDDAIIIRIPKEWVGHRRARQLTEADVLRMVARGEQEFRHGKTQEFGAFLPKRRSLWYH